MRTLFRTLAGRMRGGRDTVLVTVIASSGSTPRGAGSRMLVGGEGRVCGTIGGGNIEHRSREMAQEILVSRNSHEHRFQLNPADVENLGMICGGSVSVYFRYIPADDAQVLALCDRAEELFASYSDMWLREGDTLELFTERPDDPGMFCEQINSSGKVYVFGCGHVGQALVPVLSHVGFRCVALDDRPEFANRDLFPDDCEVALCDFNDIGKTVTITGNDYVCIMTRGHAFDAIVEGQVLKTPARYVGVIGSARKKAGVARMLVEEYGVDPKELDRIVSPVGLNIKAETPAEIAVSIAAQMIQLRAETNGK